MKNFFKMSKNEKDIILKTPNLIHCQKCGLIIDIFEEDYRDIEIQYQYAIADGESEICENLQKCKYEILCEDCFQMEVQK